MDKHCTVRRIWLALVLLAGIAVGMLVQAKVSLSIIAQAGVESNALVSMVAESLEKNTVALERTTAERDRLLEHLAAIESTQGTSCAQNAGVCPAREVRP